MEMVWRVNRVARQDGHGCLFPRLATRVYMTISLKMGIAIAIRIATIATVIIISTTVRPIFFIILVISGSGLVGSVFPYLLIIRLQAAMEVNDTPGN